MLLAWDEETGTMMDAESWTLLFQCKIVDFQAEMAIGSAESKIRMEKLFLAIDEAFEREEAEAEAEARHLQE
jgi:hypothetical protein